MNEMSVSVAPRRRTAARHSLDYVATVFDTELGWMGLAQRDQVLAGNVFGHASPGQAAEALRRVLGVAIDFLEADELPAAIREVVDRLCNFAAGEAVDFRDVEIDDGYLTRFGRRVMNACRRIPRGQTRSYGELAAACGSAGAARAVGQVMAGNRYPLVVPCHRVVGASGSLGGFSAPQGLAMKRRLLALEIEQPNFSPNRSRR
jgi:methylated-DNA-[protein]-cysteine S-methyltransferase